MKAVSLFSLAVLAGCASSPQVVSVEKKGSVTLVHHRQHFGNKSIDHLEAINAKGVVSQATVEVYDIGRLPDGNGGMREAGRYYRVGQSSHFDLRLPERNGFKATGPKTVFTPPNYSPTPKDQRINDAVAEAKAAKDRLDKASEQIQQRLKDDNVLKGQLQEEVEANQKLQDQLSAAMATPKKPEPSDAQKAAESSIDPLAQWGQKVSNQ
jgi:hypothetical protein